MKKDEKKLFQIAKKVEGNVLVIGVQDEKLLEVLNQNEKILKCDLLNSVSNSGKDNKKPKKKKNFNIRKLRKKYRKKKIDNIICNMEDIYPYLKTFVKDSVYINRGKLYFYGEQKKYDLDRMIQKYKKYHAKVEHTYDGTYFYLTISNEHSKTNFLKDFWIQLCDGCYWLYEIIGDLLIN